MVVADEFYRLVLSGFALQYPDSWLAALLGGSENLRRIIHRVAAVVMLVVGVYHLAYLVMAKEGRLWLNDMLVRGKDFRDVLGNFNTIWVPQKPNRKLLDLVTRRRRSIGR